MSFIKKMLIKAAVFVIFVFILYCGICIVFPMEYYDTVKEYSEKYDLDPALVMAVINVESGFNTEAVSGKGARGLMQLMEETALWAAPQVPVEDFTIFRLNEPDVNISIGCWYLDHLMDKFDGDIKLAIAAYNAGSGNVNNWLYDKQYSEDGKTLSNIPFYETDKYVKKITACKYVYDILIKVRFYEIV